MMFDFKVKDVNGKEDLLEDYKGKFILIANKVDGEVDLLHNIKSFKKLHFYTFIIKIISYIYIY